MPDALYIIDGYNLLRNLSPYREILKESLEESRARLLEDLINFRATTGRNITIVFDGVHGKTAVPQESELLGVHVWFSGKGQTADSLVEKLAFEKSGGTRVVVVTSDLEQQRAVFRDGVYRQTPSHFISELLEEKERFGEEADSTRMFLEDRLEERVKEELDRLFE